MNSIERAIESCRARHGKFLGDYQGDISDEHRRKLEKQMQAEQVKISALEKQIPKKPILRKNSDNTIFRCPKDNRRIGESNEYGDIEGFKYCPDCGQAIDWRNEDD